MNIIHKTIKDENNNTIFDIDSLCNSKMKIEPPYEKTGVVQCTRCQNYVQFRVYCTRTYKYVC